MARAMDIDEVVARLGVKRETVYAYVSRGVLHSQRTREGSTFDRDEVEALAARGRRRPLPGEGIDVVLASSEAVELSPQNAYIRRLQHQMAERANLVSRSRGREPYRRVRLYPETARSAWR